MKHVLLVAFHYPPEASSSGVLRTLKYTQYLPSRGWRCTVLTVQPSAYTVVDSDLEKKIPQATRVVRTRYLNTKRHLAVRGIYPAVLAVPDVWSGWWWFGRRAGAQLLRRDPADLVYSTSPHATAHMIARSLARRANVPWVMDFRDPWYEEPPEEGTPMIVHRCSRALESRAVRQASAVVASTRHLTDTLRARYPRERQDKFVCIVNGYDEADFRSFDCKDVRSPKLTIVHTGSINPGFRDPRPLVGAFRRAVDRGLLRAEEIDLRFLGAGTAQECGWLASYVEECGLSHVVSIMPRINYDLALEQLASSTVSLLLQASADTAGLVPAKLYEYLRMQRPVLAFVGQGASREIMDELGAGWAVDPSQPGPVDRAIEEVVELWRNDRLGEKKARLEDLRRYSREHLAGQLAEVFAAAIQDRHNA